MVALVTGSAGLIGTEAARFFADKGMDVIGIDNDMRAYFFGTSASTDWSREQLQADLPGYHHESIDIRDIGALRTVFSRYGKDIELVLHTAAQPSHDWAAREPLTDFSVNATGTLNLLELAREICPDAPFIFTSTNKVYGDTPNRLPLEELETRWELSPDHQFFSKGIDESMSIDGTLHSLFGASKVAADILVQEYGRYFGLKTACFRGGCLTGPGHSGAELHGFLAYLAKCALTGDNYTVFGYKGKQVRDNIHSHDLVNAFWHFYEKPRVAEIYNIGGGRNANCSMLEAIAMAEKITGKKFNWTYSDTHRVGDHMWWVSDITRFESHYPEWRIKHGIEEIMRVVIEGQSERLPD
ncbi:MAG: NAD-dependent epimerase/dehydratase family protein [Proteobacteria bacterium]|nr:NAD-dependent epimerase/dehydratase family protein [Pseudomonadota bacterium]